MSGDAGRANGRPWLRAVAALCAPTYLFVVLDLLSALVPEKEGTLTYFALLGTGGFVVGLIAPVLTAGALVAGAWATLRRRESARGLLVIWLLILLAFFANLHVAHVLSRF